MNKKKNVDPDHHIPVLLEDVLKSFNHVEKIQLENKQDVSYLDGTFGRGGHFQAVLEKFPVAYGVGLDRDDDALSFGKNKFAELIAQNKVQLVKSSFSQVDQKLNELKQQKFDMILLDLGVSSPQLDQSHRGFSFYHDGPLDMRMDIHQEVSAATLVNDSTEEELEYIFKELGEVDRPHRVIKAILQDREEKPFKSTLDLSALIERVDGWRQKGFHPATRYFMGLRIAVNRELEEVEVGVPKMMELLNPGGVLVVLTFHSLEDRIVKNIFKSSELGQPIQKKVIQASWHESKKNPRARSAKLRAFKRS